MNPKVLGDALLVLILIFLVMVLIKIGLLWFT